MMAAGGGPFMGNQRAGDQRQVKEAKQGFTGTRALLGTARSLQTRDL